MADTPAEIFRREDELEKIGLDIPQVTKILNTIRKKGYNIPDGIFEISEAADILAKILKGDTNA